MLIATGLRRSSCSGCAGDFDAAAGTIAVTGKVVRETGGLFGVDDEDSRPPADPPAATLRRRHVARAAGAAIPR